MDNHVVVLGKEINTKGKSIAEVIKEAVALEDIKMNEVEANKLYRFISNEFKEKDSRQS